jgi:phosphatidylserine/phosphatidylglycerophosphate/cardiolipin synthase-like enzyme
MDLINSLIKAKKRGIDVKILMDRKAEDTNTKYTGLDFQIVPDNLPNVIPMIEFEKENVNVRYFDPVFFQQELHIKACLVDDNRYILGSSNFTTQAFSSWRETSVEVMGGKTPEQLKQIFMMDWKFHSSPAEKTNWGHFIKAYFTSLLEKNYIGWW